jgi:hypothetical protein
MATSEAENRPGRVSELSQGSAVLRGHEAEHDAGGLYTAVELAMNGGWEDVGD